ncbi:N-acyl homoserine lactone hydrolase [Paraburkholderia sacchari]|uniref:N-acyl homoserine lactonase family protein n=1 Tax=Paraburkholderia sacchari TaxID=159450 RepID=UPI0039A76731
MALYSIWMLEYAYAVDVPLAGLVYGWHGADSVTIPFSYVLAKGRDSTILIDCGYNNDAHGRVLAERSNLRNWHAPQDVLAQCGVRPEQIDHVIITHAHYDHIGGLRHFPNARFYLQERELSQWLRIMDMPRSARWLMDATDPSDIIHAAELATAGRLITIGGDAEDILPGIDVHLAADSHTAGSQFVVFRNDGARQSQDAYVCTGDLVYRPENLHGGNPDDPFYVPVGFAMGSQTNLILATDAMLKIVGHDIDRVLAPHADEVYIRHPSRKGALGLRIAEITLANGHDSVVG